MAYEGMSGIIIIINKNDKKTNNNGTNNGAGLRAPHRTQPKAVPDLDVRIRTDTLHVPLIPIIGMR